MNHCLLSTHRYAEHNWDSSNTAVVVMASAACPQYKGSLMLEMCTNPPNGPHSQRLDLSLSPGPVSLSLMKRLDRRGCTRPKYLLTLISAPPLTPSRLLPLGPCVGHGCLAIKRYHSFRKGLWLLGSAVFLSHTFPVSTLPKLSLVLRAFCCCEKALRAFPVLSGEGAVQPER